MLLRFKEQHCIDPSNRICYETVTDEAIWDYDEEACNGYYVTTLNY